MDALVPGGSYVVETDQHEHLVPGGEYVAEHFEALSTVPGWPAQPWVAPRAW